jgi:predicted flap endonuclease-1-like 5' DNA nuclease
MESARARADSIDLTDVAVATEDEAPDLGAAAPTLDVEISETKDSAPSLEVDLEGADVSIPEAQVDLSVLADSKAPADEEPSEPQNLKIIEGIGPKYESVLHEAGVLTYAQLASTGVEQIKEILAAADTRYGRLADPTTWPEQASLAAAGDWDGLEVLKEQMTAGRRPSMT